MRGNVEQTIRYLVREMNQIGWRERFPQRCGGYFLWIDMNLLIPVRFAIQGNQNHSKRNRG